MNELASRQGPVDPLSCRVEERARRRIASERDLPRVGGEARQRAREIKGRESAEAREREREYERVRERIRERRKRPRVCIREREWETLERDSRAI